VPYFAFDKTPLLESPFLVTPGTTNRIVIDPPRAGAGEGRPMDSATVESGGGYLLKLEYPKGLSPSGHADAQRRFAPLSPELAQQLLTSWKRD
jgi:hypothetical protein